jgi:hypothetical protein
MIEVRGEASEGLAELVQRAQTAREREVELQAEQRAKAADLEGPQERRVELLQAHEAAALDGRRRQPAKELAELEERIERLAGEVSRGMADHIEARRRERERREQAVTGYVDERRDELIGEVKPAQLEAEEEVRGCVRALLDAYARAKTIAYQELDLLLRRLPGNLAVPDSTTLDQPFAQLERIAGTETLFAPRALAAGLGEATEHDGSSDAEAA